MPIYEYRCGDCGQRKDHLQKISDALLDSCPACGSKSYSKILTAAGFQLKGNGWYATDFKSSAGAAAKTDSTESVPKVDSPTAPTTSAPTSVAAESSSASGSCKPGCACH